MKTFTTWLESKRPAPLVQPSDRLVQLIAAAGPGGISYSNLISTVDLDRGVIDGLFAAMTSLGMVKASGAGLRRVYRYSCRLV